MKETETELPNEMTTRKPRKKEKEKEKKEKRETKTKQHRPVSGGKDGEGDSKVQLLAAVHSPKSHSSHSARGPPRSCWPVPPRRMMMMMMRSSPGSGC